MIHYSHIPPPPHHIVVTIGFEQVMYPTQENVTTMICARVLEGELDREITVTITSRDESTTGAYMSNN